MAPRTRRRLRLVLLDIGIDNPGDVVFVFFDFLQQIVVFFFLVFDLFFEIFLLDRLFRRRSFALFAVFVGFHYGLVGLGRFLFLEFLFITGGLGILVLEFLVLRILELFLFRLLNDGGGFGGFRHSGAALLQQHFRFKGKVAFWTFDRALLQIVKTSCARGAYAFGAEIGFDQGVLPGCDLGPVGLPRTG